MLARPLGVLLVCALALPHAFARSSDDAVSAQASAPTKGSSAPARAGAAATGRDLARSAPAGVAGRDLAGVRLFRRVAANTTRRLARAAAARRLLPPPAVRRVIAAGDRIATAPYGYGGGHGNWDAGAYDCSGSVSYALHGGGLLDVALDSGQFMSWGEPGPGRWISVYASPGHAFMVVAGRRFDTTGREQTGSRWQSTSRDASGYVVRHPRGL